MHEVVHTLKIIMRLCLCFIIFVLERRSSGGVNRGVAQRTERFTGERAEDGIAESLRDGAVKGGA